MLTGMNRGFDARMVSFGEAGSEPWCVISSWKDLRFAGARFSEKSLVKNFTTRQFRGSLARASAQSPFAFGYSLVRSGSGIERSAGLERAGKWNPPLF
jgi:hypothetical protein